MSSSSSSSSGDSPPPPPPAPKKQHKGAKLLPLAASVGIGLALRFLVPIPTGLEPKAWSLLAVFVSTIAGLVLEPLPTGAWAAVAATAAVASRASSWSRCRRARGRACARRARSRRARCRLRKPSPRSATTSSGSSSSPFSSPPVSRKQGSERESPRCSSEHSVPQRWGLRMDWRRPRPSSPLLCPARQRGPGGFSCQLSTLLRGQRGVCLVSRRGGVRKEVFLVF